MISLYSGTPGSGKSLHTAQVIYWRLRTGKPTFGNFEIDQDKVKHRKGAFMYIPNDELRVADLIAFSRSYFADHRFSEGALMLIVDEAQLLFNARQWDAKGRADWLSFFTQHRKYGYDVILIAQFDRMIDRQIRSLIEYEYIHRKVSNFGFWGKLFSVVALGKLFVSVKMWYPLRERVGCEWFTAKKQYYSLYDSYKHFEAGTEVSSAEQRTDGTEPDQAAATSEGVYISQSGVTFREVG